MRCIILNSGKGTRLEELTKKTPKSLVHLNSNETIFSRAVKILLKFDIDEFIITTGYLNNVLENYSSNNFFDCNFTFVYNPDYENTNYIKSIDLIPDFDDDVILLHGDLVFNRKTAEMVIESDKTSVIIDSTISIPQDDFKAKVINDEVKYIGIDYFEDDAVACQPFYKLTQNDWNQWKDKIHEFCKAGDTNVYAENALNTIINDLILNAIDLKGELCMEVDTKEDLKKVKEILNENSLHCD